MTRRHEVVRRWGQVLLLSLALGAGAAAQQGEPFEQRFQALAAQLRCVVCQNQSLADSPAELATDLKQVLREQLQAGASDEAVLDFMVQRYGEAVLYRPRLQARTGLLWFGPALLLLLGLLLLGRQLRSPVNARADVTEDQLP
ncbi:cytochrome c-type biogenesis protein [Pelomonas sp. BJYL3]|uniref:cytochrome c-type biogenesis protein n=1 Tax=Pelomonas sp. BJYL3 TaxID=2976697 RepID=UPI0022B2FA60|nr:cytochrome c-type biogenesis protein [Pelomonas sp. BJYL3]